MHPDQFVKLTVCKVCSTGTAMPLSMILASNYKLLLIGVRMHACEQATEMTEDADMWPHLAGLYKTLAQQARGVRMSGSAATNLCRVASGEIAGKSPAHIHFQCMLHGCTLASEHMEARCICLRLLSTTTHHMQATHKLKLCKIEQRLVWIQASPAPF